MADSTTAVSVAAIDPNPTLNPPNPSPTPVTLFPNPNPVAIPPPSQSMLTPIQASFVPGTQQFSTVAYQTPPPGVIMASVPPAPPQIPMMALPYTIAGQPVRYAAPPMPNGYPAMPPPGVLRYPSPYGPMLRPGFPPRPMIGAMPQLARPPIFGIRGPILPPTVRPAAIPIITPADKPQTTVYIGKISITVDNEFMHSILELCGPVKNWKRPQDPTGTLKGFGFCEFESAEGVLRALRLLSKLSIDGQELMVNVNQGTREYLERFVEKKSESLKKSEELEKDTQNEEPTTGGTDRTETVKSSEEPLKLPLDDQKKHIGENSNKEDLDTVNFGLVNNEDKEADHEALGKLRQMLEERQKNRPLPPHPPPPQVPVDASGNSNSEHHAESKDIESEDIAKNDSEDENEDDKTAESKLSNRNNRTEPVSPDRSRRHERPRHRDDEQKRERDRELELEKDERDRLLKIAKKDKDREYKSREDERRYKNREKEWEGREREREHWRKREREREKDKAQERKWEVIDQENDNNDGHSKKRKHKVSDEDRKRRQREKEDDISDRLREEEEIAEAKMKAEEEQRKKLQEALNVISGQPANGLEKAAFANEANLMELDKANDDQNVDNKPSRGLVEGEVVLPDGVSNEPVASLNNNAPTKKLGFGLSGTGKRAAVPSLFMAGEDEDAHKDKKMRPLVPIDYSTEEQQPSEFPSSNVVAATEFVKCISTANVKEEKPDLEKERSSRRSHERSSRRDRGRHEEETYSSRGESRKDDRDRSSKKSEIPKILDAKQLIDTIPKTRDELFTYEINWAIYDQNSLHDRMRPWISKKITEFLGEEEVTLVDYIVSSTQEHVDAGEMLERLQTILDDEAEMFVLKMWRMLIFEIKKVETGLTPKLRS